MRRWFFYVAFLFLVAVLFDGVLIISGLYPPKRLYGDPTLGFVTPEGTGSRNTIPTLHWRFVHSDSGIIELNERGFRTERTIQEILFNPQRMGIAVIGDSQTELPYRNELTHPFVLQKVLRDSGLTDVEVFAAGRGKYSPLQAYLYFREYVLDLHPAVLILNLYTGNDFFDLMRVDDRPYLESDNKGRYRIHPPEWYRLADPDSKGGWKDKSRLWFLVQSIGEETRISTMWARFRYLIDLARKEGKGFNAVASYMYKLYRTEESEMAYPGAYPSQILNQYLFFKYFPESMSECLARLKYLLALVRHKHPDLLLILSPIPSASLAGSLEDDTLFRRKLESVGISYEDLLHQEQAFHDSSVSIAHSLGWETIVNLAPLRENKRQIFMPEDLHLSPAGSQILGANEAAKVLTLMGRAIE